MYIGKGKEIQKKNHVIYIYMIDIREFFFERMNISYFDKTPSNHLHN